MTNIRLYDGQIHSSDILRRRAWREAAAERLQDKLDREYLHSPMTLEVYDERCGEIAAFIETDCLILPPEFALQLAEVMQ